MRKISILFIALSFIVFIASCTKTSEEKPTGESNISSSTSESLQQKLAATKWNILFNGQSYGTIQFNADGTCVKKAEGGGIESRGTWELNGESFTLSFPSEGDPFSGLLSESGDNLIAKFMDGAIIYTYMPAK